MDLAKYFIIAFILSALGTIPIGLITLTIAQKTIEKGKSAGWQISLETLYANRDFLSLFTIRNLLLK